MKVLNQNTDSSGFFFSYTASYTTPSSANFDFKLGESELVYVFTSKGEKGEQWRE